jgi:integrase
MRGHIEHKRSRYYVVLELDPETDPETGAVVRQRVGGGRYDRKRDAQDALADALERGRHGWRGPAQLTVATYLRDEWLPGVDLSLAETTAALYRTLVEAYIVPRIGGKRLDTVSGADLTTMYADLLKSGRRGGKPLAPKTVRHVHTTLRKALSDAVSARHIPFNPAANAKAPRVASMKDPDTWTADDLRTFLESVAGSRLEALWLLAASTGMRRSELLGVLWRDVDLETGELDVRNTRVAYAQLVVTKEPKTATSRRSIPLDAHAVAALKAHRKRQLEEKLRAGEAYGDEGTSSPTRSATPFPPPRSRPRSASWSKRPASPLSPSTA